MFKKKLTNIPLDIELPDGLFYRNLLDRSIFYKKDGVLFSVSEIVFGTWNTRALPTSQRNLDHYRRAGKLGFRDGTLIKNFVDGRIYLISNSRRRLVTSPNVLAQLGGEGAVMSVADEYIKMHLEGEPISD